jgi:hypothetical protein
MKITMKATDAALFDDLLGMISNSALQLGKPDAAQTIEGLRTPFKTHPVEIDEMQAMALQAMLVGLIKRSETGRPGFSSEAVRLMRELSAELNNQQRRPN